MIAGAQAAVIVPVHKAHPSELELVSLRQCGRVLTSRNIFLVAPVGLELGRYKELISTADEVRVDPDWMNSLAAYNRLMIAPIVYEALSDYSHALIHEPDAIVLTDELDYWCSQPYDYIGAPWFRGYCGATGDAPLIGVGNFGFSLHRLQSTRRVVKSWRRWRSSAKQISSDLLHACLGRRSRLKRAIRDAGRAGRLRGAWRSYEGPCDLFWSEVVPRVVPNFRVAPADVALHFAWETLPSRCFELCDGKPPFGIHAWARYDFSFVKPILDSHGVDLQSADDWVSA